MGNIVLLDENTINQIAAGEVIERPANVVKELLENSIDADADKITIEVKNGGKSLIKIVDNGKGMSLEDMSLSVERHATSKIRRVEDLENTYTMGFRGEALASIASISNISILSRPAGQEYANKLVVEEGNIIGGEETYSQQGTTIEVKNLFFNTPVRYKFLKNDATEFRYIKEWVERIALSNPNVSIKLFNNGKQAFFSNGSGNLRDIVYMLYGKDVTEKLVDVDFKNEEIRVTGVIGNTMVARDSRKDQITFLNRRYIKNSLITNSADQAFKGATGIGKYGFYILNIEMPATMYDVNVHPTKMEVRFKDEDLIYKTVFFAIKEAYLNRDFLGNTSNEDKTKYIENEYNFINDNYNKIDNLTLFDSKEDVLLQRVAKREIDYKYLGIIFKTFIIIQIEDKLYFIDQHAAHERVLYEKIKENYKKNLSQNTQLMFFCEVVTLSHKEMDFVKEHMQLFENAGFDIEIFGNNEVKINGLPDIDFKMNKRNVFLDVLDEMITNERNTSKDVEERFIATVACKAAVKAGMVLAEDEVHKLIDELLMLNNPYTCPHGRPTTIKYDSSDIDELFKKGKYVNL